MSPSASSACKVESNRFSPATACSSALARMSSCKNLLVHGRKGAREVGSARNQAGLRLRHMHELVTEQCTTTLRMHIELTAREMHDRTLRDSESLMAQGLAFTLCIGAERDAK